MDWKNILKMDVLKLFIIMILLIFPFISTGYVGSKSPEFTSSFEGNIISIGLPFHYIKMDYISQSQITDPPTAGAGGVISRFTGSYLFFILDIIIAYLIGVILSFGYFSYKKRKD